MASSVPGSPSLVHRSASPRAPHRIEKEVGEVTHRLNRLQPHHTKYRRDDGDSEDDCCSTNNKRKTTNTLKVPGAATAARNRSASPGATRGAAGLSATLRGVSPGGTSGRATSPNVRSGVRGTSPNVRATGGTRGTSPNVRATGAVRGVSPNIRSGATANTAASRPAPRPASVGPRRPPTNTLAPGSRLTAGSSPRASPRPSPRASPSPRTSPSPRNSPARALSVDRRKGRGKTPNLESARSGSSHGAAEIDLNDPEILAKIGNRQVKTVSNNKPSRNCDSCGKVLTEDGHFALGKVFHKECFKCHGCHKKLDGKFFTKDDKPFCRKCHTATTEQCTVCKQKIIGDCVVNNDTFYHPDCMRCSICDVKLRGVYHFFQNKPICDKDFKECMQNCSKCGETIEGTYYTLNDLILCEKDFKEYMETCGACHQPIAGQVIKTCGLKYGYHPECFKCKVCDMNLAGVHFSTDNQDNLYCPNDFNKKFAAQCCVCKKPIVPKEGHTTAPRIRAMDRDFHPNCFKCEDCGLVLDTRVKGKECWPIRSHVLCHKCFRRRQSESEAESDEE